MKTALLSVGTELLFGQITNTNTVFLSQQLNLLGFDVLYHYTVGDNAKRLAEVMETASRTTVEREALEGYLQAIDFLLGK